MQVNHASRIGDLAVERDGYVATVTIDRPEKLNALTAAFWGDLRVVMDRLADDGETRVAILTGAGDRAFSAGGDIRGFLELETIEQMRAYQIDAMSAFAHLERTPFPIVGAVNGLAFGGGCELLLACDLVIAADSATFAMPEAVLGLVPGFGALRLPEVVGRQMAKFMIATGEVITAAHALEIGLIQQITPAAELRAKARDVALRIASRSPQALTAAKRMINRSIDQAAFDYAVEELTVLQSCDDRDRGVEAFLSKKTPVFGPRRASEGR